MRSDRAFGSRLGVPFYNREKLLPLSFPIFTRRHIGKRRKASVRLRDRMQGTHVERTRSLLIYGRRDVAESEYHINGRAVPERVIRHPDAAQVITLRRSDVG